MLPLASVGVIVLTVVGTMSCHFIFPYIYKRTWRRYSRLKDFEKCRVDRYFGTAVTSVLSFVFALKAFISDSDFQQLGLVGSSVAGNVALDIMIGQCISDLLYEKKVEGTFGSIRNVGHHFAVIVVAVVAHNFFHRLIVYRFIHHISFPSLKIYDLMKLECDTRGGLFWCAMYVNLGVYFLFRIAVIPFHWVWYIYEIVTSQDEWSAVWLLALLLLIAGSIVIDCLNCMWGWKLMKRYREVMKPRRSRERED